MIIENEEHSSLNEEYKSLKSEYEEVKNNIDDHYSRELKSIFSFLYIIIPLLILSIILGIYNYIILSSVAGSVCGLIALLNIMDLIAVRSSWNKASEYAEFVYQVKLLQAILRFNKLNIENKINQIAKENENEREDSRNNC